MKNTKRFVRMLALIMTITVMPLSVLAEGPGQGAEAPEQLQVHQFCQMAE